jgi:hypothetical protein
VAGWDEFMGRFRARAGNFIDLRTDCSQMSYRHDRSKAIVFPANDLKRVLAVYRRHELFRSHPARNSGARESLGTRGPETAGCISPPLGAHVRPQSIRFNYSEYSDQVRHCAGVAASGANGTGAESGPAASRHKSRAQ